jgi:DMSO/TMAO reductase YedYZ molybdopterin-dependent catalytic subunit
MAVDRRTFMRLAAAGLGSAVLPLAGCARPIGQASGATRPPTPDAPLTPAESWFRVSIQGAYEADRQSYRLLVGGVCDRSLTLGDQALRGTLTPRLVPITLACVGNPPGGQLLSSALFRGARVSDLMDAAGVSPRASGALITGLDGFAALQSIEDLRRPESIIAYDMGTSEGDLAPLPVEHGFPARILTPGLYGYMQPKWIDAITFIEQDGYQDVLRASVGHLRGSMQLASGFSRPRGGEIGAGAEEVLGYAFGDGRPIGAVHVRVDGGPWQEAEIVYNKPKDDLPPWLWCLFRFSWKATPGRHELTSRATYVDGETQIAGRAFPDSGGSLASIQVTVKA